MPTDGWALRDGLTVTPTYSCELNLYNIGLWKPDGSTWGYEGPITDVYLAQAYIGSAASPFVQGAAEWDTFYLGHYDAMGEPHEHAAPEPGVPGYYGMYAQVWIAAHAAGETAEFAQVWVWCFDWASSYQGPTYPNAHAGAIYDGGEKLTFTCTIELQGVSLYEQTSDVSLVDMYPADAIYPPAYPLRLLGREWVLDEGATMQVTVAGHGVSVSNTHAFSGTDIAADFTLNVDLPIANYRMEGVTAGVENITAAGGAAEVTDLPLYYPGKSLVSGGERNAYHSGWGYEAGTNDKHRLNAGDGGITLECLNHVSSGGTANYWPLTAPYGANLVPGSLFADPAGTPADITYHSTAQQWDPGTAAYVDVTHAVETLWVEWPSIGWQRRPQKRFRPQANNGPRYPMQVRVDPAWIAANGEVDTDTTSPIRCYPLTATTLQGSPMWAAQPFAISKAATLNVAPSAWTLGDGVTGDPTGFVVEAETVAPTVTGTYATRHDLRMARLEAGEDDGYCDFVNWPISGPNNDLGADDAEWQAAVPTEGQWQWSEFCYLSLPITAPKAGFVQITVRYRTRTNTLRATFTSDDEAHEAVYTLPVLLGANTLLVDLACPVDPTGREAPFTPCGVAKMWHVDEVELVFPDAGASQETWVVGVASMDLTNDTGHTSESHYRVILSDGGQVAFGAVHDGKDVLELLDQYGYAERVGMDIIPHLLSTERKIARSSWVRTPKSGWEDPAVAEWESSYKDIAELADEVGRQAGWTATFTDPADTAENQDTDDNYLFPVLGSGKRWVIGDLSNETAGGAVQFSPLVDMVQLAPMLCADVRHETTLRGRFHGIAKTYDGAERRRSEADLVRIYDETGACVDTADVDAQGYWASAPLKQEGGPYHLDFMPGLAAVWNREWTFLQTLVRTPAEDPAVCTDPQGITWVAFLYNTRVLCAYLDAQANPAWGWAGIPFPAGGMERPSIAVCADGSLLVAATDTAAGDMLFARSRDRGRTWEAVATADLGDGLERGAIYHRNGQTWCVGWDADEVTLVGSSSGDLTREGLSSDANETLKVCDAVVGEGDTVPRSAVTETADGRGILVVVDVGGSLTAYRARDLRTAAGFTVVA